jgi:hypothetical protein
LTLPKSRPIRSEQGYDENGGKAMKVDGFLSLKDYFNYYLSGFVWVIDFIIFGILVWPLKSYYVLMKNVGFVIEKIGPVVAGIVLLIITYIIGFVLFPISQATRRIWQGKNRKWFPRPRKWLIIKSEDLEEYKSLKKPFLKGSRFSNKEVSRFVELAEKRFGLNYKININLLFYPVRTYVIEHGGDSANFAQRMRDLMSLSESLLFPVSLFFGLLLTMFTKGGWDFLGIPLAIFIQILIVYRYHRIEIDWVKRIYRSFLAIESRKD